MSMQMDRFQCSRGDVSHRPLSLPSLQLRWSGITSEAFIHHHIKLQTLG